MERLSSAKEKEYEEYLQRKPWSLFYHSSKYKYFLKDLLGCEEKYLVAFAGSSICGILPLMYTQTSAGRVYNSLPYFGSNGGIIADDAKTYSELAAAYNELACSKTTLAATIIDSPFGDHFVTPVPHNLTDWRIGQFTELPPGKDCRDVLMAQVEPSARRNVQKAMREGVSVEVDYSQIDRLREMHQENISALGGIPKNDKFFAFFPRYFTPGADFDLYVAKKDGTVVASLLLFYFNKTAEYFMPAVQKEFRSIQPLSLLIITAMTRACERGFTCWNWGGTWPSQTGLYRFKKKWAAMEQRYYYYTQLNDGSILDWPQAKILSTFPNFFLVPFSALNGGRTHEQ